VKSSSAIVVFAHVPPPHHGQSYMVKLMLEGLQKEAPGRTVYHVNAQVSNDLADVGTSGWRKLGRLIGYCVQALRYRIFQGAKTLYYIPAPAKKSAIIRDIVALTLLRPFFPRLILHWHAVGLGAWVMGSNEFADAPRGLTAKLLRPYMRVLLRGADPAICIAPGNVPDAETFVPRSVVMVPNGIPDPCTDFALICLEREERTTRVRAWLNEQSAQPQEDTIRVGYLGHCLRTKGFFDALEAVRLAAVARPDLRWQLTIAGSFASADEEKEGVSLIETLRAHGIRVHLHGFLQGDEKKSFLRNIDVLLFPSWSESFGLVAVEALAFGLPVIASDIPGIRGVLDGTNSTLVPPKDTPGFAAALCRSSSYPAPWTLRKKYEENFTLEIFQKRIVEALR
jgi:glycosyltransferase involved in cell wall biosynthesis